MRIKAFYGWVFFPCFYFFFFFPLTRVAAKKVELVGRETRLFYPAIHAGPVD